MKISIVTISYNQAKYLRECIDSVLSQNYIDIEYIIVDPGSTDGSREIIDSYGDRVTRVYGKDSGPADGLNKGFSHATGSIFCYLNSDDCFLPNAFESVIELFSDSTIDILTSDAYIIDSHSEIVRAIYSDKFNLKSVAYDACLSVQPSTFFRKRAYEKINGFNVLNKSNWDEELLIDMVISGASITYFKNFLSCYRVHDMSITGTGRLKNLHEEYNDRMFYKIMNRPYEKNDFFMKILYRMKKHIINPLATLERIRKGPVFGSVDD